MSSDQTRIYTRKESVVFLKTKEAFGGLSNMAGGFPLEVNSIRIRSAEALYQACRFPHLPDVQRLIIEQISPMTAKMKSRPYLHDSRADWQQVRVKVMRWCLRVKLAQNWSAFSQILLETGARPIVEQSSKDSFWGGNPIDDQTLVGMNVLGRLLMELREEVKSCDRASFLHVEPLGVSKFRLYGQQIQPVEADGIADDLIAVPRLGRTALPSAMPTQPMQASLFGQPPPNDKTEPWRKTVDPPGGSMDDPKPYPAMKHSGVEWLGEVPEHWEVVPNRALFNEIKDRDYPDEQMLSVTIKQGVIRQASLLENTSKKDSSNLDRSNYKLVQPGDIAYNKMRAWQGAVGVSHYRGIISPAYVVQRPRAGGDLWYFHYLLRTPAFAKEAERWSYGITSDMWSLRPEHFKMIYACLPPLPEQTAIVHFLNYMDRRISKYIRAKQSLIDLLEEQKQVIIHRAVTRGLDPDVPLKPSGVEWLGDVPEHWEVRRLKSHVSNVVDQTNQRERDEIYVALEHVESWTGRLRAAGPNVGFDSQVKRFQTGDVLFGKLRPYLAKVTRPDRNGVCVGEFLVLRPNGSGLLPSYLEQIIRSKSIIDAINTSTFGAKMPRADWQFIGGMALAFPPFPEQEKIVEYLDRATTDISTAIDRARREIELLHEYRTRLIADVVTGKVDVREAAASLPEESDEPEAHDEADDLMDEGEAMSDDLDTAPKEAEV